jgi:nucleotide-binding universal stress UspA family protein
MFKSVLVPIDIAHQSSWEFALPQAAEIAQAGGRNLAVMTVVRTIDAVIEGVQLQFQLEQMIAAATTKLAQIVGEHVFQDVVVDQEVRFGSIGQEIVDAAEERGVDLIVMASHRPEMRDYLIGPNSAHVAQNASCSVLVLRQFERN